MLAQKLKIQRGPGDEIGRNSCWSEKGRQRSRLVGHDRWRPMFRVVIVRGHYPVVLFFIVRNGHQAHDLHIP